MSAETTSAETIVVREQPAPSTHTLQTQQPLTKTQTQPAAVREDGVTLIALYHFLLGAIALLGTVGLSIPALITGIVGVVDDSDALIATVILGALALVTMMLCVLLLAVGYGLWSQRQWARVAAIAIALLGLFAFPIGTVIGGVTVWYLLKPNVAQHFR